ncbi:response regulator receiver protein [Paenibacillus curdlanolyticus YK9]|uniref:Response regulator receiver protein n=1 Tax=Paenibacillus curdlanolyticus YK9 TaxID=717606 RepID=E0IDD9_9BACL|nr:response regulator receiver protein [Paenibacillus curdlanolyticus YK9]
MQENIASYANIFNDYVGYVQGWAIVVFMGGYMVEKNKVLIVDDQNGIRVLLMEVFSSEGYSTFQASNGKLALEIVRQEKPDLVLLDMKIPGMDGLEILRHIKTIDVDIKVIMMTAYGELDIIKEATDLGALMHFTKPFDIDEMRLAVNSQLRGDQTNNRYAIGT